MHVYKLINLCTCVCRSYTSACGQNAEEKKEGKGEEGRRQGEIKSGSGEGCWGKEGRKGEEKRSEEEENTWIYLKHIYTRVRPIQKEGALNVRKKQKSKRGGRRGNPEITIQETVREKERERDGLNESKG